MFGDGKGFAELDSGAAWAIIGGKGIRGGRERVIDDRGEKL